MKRSTIASLIGLAFTSPTFAADNIKLADVVVTASRVPQALDSIIGDVTVIDAEEIKRAGQSTFIELLQSQPGVEIASTGGAGQISSIFLRGTNSNQVLVLIDGIRVGSVSSGSTAFGNISLSQIDHIEILRGPATSLYGQDAIGGVIHIFTKRGDGTPHFNASIGYGGYNTKTAAVGFSGGVESLKYSLNISSYDTGGFSAKHITTGVQSDNDGYRNLSVNGAISFIIAEGHEVGIQLLNSDGRVNYDNSNMFNNYVDLTQTSIGIFTKNQLTDNWKSTLKLSKGIDKNNDSSFSDYYNNWSYSNFKSIQNQYSWQNDVALPVGTLTLLYDRLEQKIISTQAYEKTSRNNDGIFIGYLADIGNQSIQTSLRTDHSSQFGTNTTGGLGYGYKLTPNWRATASYGTAFKAPTFNDLYAIGWGENPNIKPEESENIEASLRYTKTSSQASITIYDNKITNLIISSGSPNYQMGNIGKAEIKGITFAASQSWNDWLLKGNINLQSPQNADNGKLLNLRANRHGALNLSKTWEGWSLSSEVIASSARFNDVANTHNMSGYALVNFLANYKVNDEWALQGRVNNLLNKNYALALDGTTPYNTPGANLFVSLIWQSK
ncbi:MAG: TonB-dependent receptor [Methylophilaceae bacterium]